MSLAYTRLLFLAGFLLAACSSPAIEQNPQPSDPGSTLGPATNAELTPTSTPLPSRTPTPTLTPEMVLLSNGEVVSRLDVGAQKLVALTIDDGFGRLPFDAILEVLRERDLQATFFLVAQAAINLGPERIAQLVTDGHQIAYHSYRHDELESLRYWTTIDWLADYEQWEDAFLELLGAEDFQLAFRAYARAPYGLFSAPFLAMTEQKGLIPFGWSRAPDDLARGIPIQSGDIFLFHVRYPDADLMVPILDESEFEFVSLDELIAAQSP